MAPRDRLDALKVLAEHPDAGEEAAINLAVHDLSLPTSELAAEVAGFFAATATVDQPD